MTYDDFEKRCIAGLINDFGSEDPKELRAYAREQGSQRIIRRLYAEGVERFKIKKSNGAAFNHCILVAVEKLNMAY